MNLLTFSTLYPNEAAPTQGIFVENRLRHVLATGRATSSVLAPIPYFPSRNEIFGAWARHARAPRTETRFGITIHHPRYLAIPRIGMNLAPHLLYAAARPALHRLLRQGAKIDLIDAHYLYPDGVAATWLAEKFHLPVILTARGSDVTQWPDHPTPRRLIRQACRGADAIITVSAGLRDALTALGVPAGKITVLRNGVDLATFAPRDRPAARARLGLTGPTLLSVGGLIARKGHDVTIAALPDLPAWHLLIAGDGPERAALQSRANTLGVADRVTFLGTWPHEDLATLYSAADISILSSAREGFANVLLESMACGTPVIASPIPGNDEAVQSPDAGRIAEARTPAAIAAAVRALSENPPDRAATRAYAENFGWTEISDGQLALFQSVLATRRRPAL